ncbi:hypothetical protein HWV62_28242 [Athelia sp. TMB]|nr:hypothetical protein HWV62_28242 [Athelia sp. TMB]
MSTHSTPADGDAVSRPASSQGPPPIEAGGTSPRTLQNEGSSQSYEMVQSSSGDALTPTSRDSPVSPSPYRPRPSGITPQGSGSGPIGTPVSVHNGAPRAAGDHSRPRTRTAGLHDSSEVPPIRFDLLRELNVPPATISYLRQFVDHHTSQTRNLRVVHHDLLTLRSDVDGTREHAVSLTSRVDRSMADAARYLLESEDQLAQLARAFDQPRSGVSPSVLRSLSPGVAPVLDAAGSLVQLSDVYTSPGHRVVEDPAENDDLYEPLPGQEQPRAVSDSASSASRREPVEGGRVPERRDSGSTRASSASAPRCPNESVEQYQTRLRAERRLAERAESAWTRAFPGVPAPDRGQPTLPTPGVTAQNVAPTDVPRNPVDPRAHREDPQGHRADVRFDEPLETMHPSVLAGLLASGYDSVSRPPGFHNHGPPARDPYSELYVRPQGLSAYRISQTPVTGGLWNNDQYHLVVLIDKVIKLINHKVGDVFEAPPGLKAPRIHEPSKYSGSSSHEEFMDWLGEFLNWLRGNYICGPACDPLRVNYLGLYVQGSASDWYLTEIDNPDRTYDPPLRFADCVALMHKRFVRTATANNADGVEGLYYQLDRAASKMIERPSDYEFRRRLFNCLPHWIQKIILTRNITPEYHQLIDIRENARQIEENSLREYEGVDDSPAPTSRTGQSIMRGAKRAAIPNKATPAVAPKVPPPVAPRKVTPEYTRMPTAARAPRPPRDTSTMNCYSCGGLGHISTQPACPNYQDKARLHAQREVDDEDEGGNEPLHDEPDCVNTWGGSQYESEADLEYAEAAEEEDQEDIVRVASMHTHPHASSFPIEEDEGGSDAPDRGGDSDDPYEGMPDLESVAGSDNEDAFSYGHGSESDDSDLFEDTDSDRESQSDKESLLSLDNGMEVPHTRPPFSGIGANRLHYMDDVLEVIPDSGRPQAYDYPAMRVTRPSTYRLVQDLRPVGGTMAPNSNRALEMPRVVCHQRFMDSVPEDHLPFEDTVTFITPTVWTDDQDRFLDFWNAGDLDEYNHLVGQVVRCVACSGRCTPVVFQRLIRASTDYDGALHRTTYVCTLDRSVERNAERESLLAAVTGLDTFRSEHIMAMRQVHSANVRRPLGDISGTISRPKQSHTTITCMVAINGHHALALLDSGSTTDSVTPEFAFVAKLRQFTLPEQVTLQLGCVGSRSKISYGTVAPVAVFDIKAEMYFDLINIDRYDAILGTPFLEKHGVCLDFRNKGVIIDGKVHKTFSIEEELAYLAKRGGVEKANRSRPAPRETAPIQVRKAAPPKHQ